MLIHFYTTVSAKTSLRTRIIIHYFQCYTVINTQQTKKIENQKVKCEMTNKSTCAVVTECNSHVNRRPLRTYREQIQQCT